MRDTVPFILLVLIIFLGSVIGANFVNGLALIYRYYDFPQVLYMVTWSTLLFDLLMAGICVAPPLMVLGWLLLRVNAKLHALTEGIRYG